MCLTDAVNLRASAKRRIGQMPERSAHTLSKKSAPEGALQKTKPAVLEVELRTDAENVFLADAARTGRGADIKRNRQSKKRKAYNKTYKVQIKNATKAVRASKDLVTAEEALRLAAKALDRSAAKGIIHKNTAANRKSSLARFVNKISLAKQAA